MTTIAINRNSIACDRQFVYGGYTKMLGKTKVYQLVPEVAKGMFRHPTAYVGFAGDAGMWSKVVNWFVDPSSKPPKISGIELVLLTGKKEIYTATSLRNWMEVEDKFWAIGSGSQFALAAMSTGQTPLEAVKTASKFDVNTGMGFKEYTI